MSVLIKGMEMPKDGVYWCEIDVAGDIATITIHDEERKSFPLIPVPPHGRLKDADALTDAIESTDWYHQAPNKEMVHGANSAEHQAWYKEQDIYSALENVPTIIEAEEDEI